MSTKLNSILSSETVDEDQIKIQADVIVTATVLGFIGTSYYLGQPCCFSIEHPKPENFEKWSLIDGKTKIFQPIIDRISTLIDSNKKIEKKEIKQKIDESYEDSKKQFQELWRDLVGDLVNDPVVGKKVVFLSPLFKANKASQKVIEEVFAEIYCAGKNYLDFLKEYQEFAHVMSAISIVLNKTDACIGNFLEDSQSNAWHPGALITDLPGGAGVDFDQRDRKIESKESKEIAQLLAEKSEQFDHFVYQGRGAYIGLLSDPVNPGNAVIYPTYRIIDSDSNRWHPGEEHDNAKRWGLIGGNKNFNLDSLPEGMGPGPLNNEKLDSLSTGERIGYIHGMSSAIHECVEHGPWCTPFELAAGKSTTKMASCFACCTYMYAAGYTPSSMHLGRGESWVPPAPKKQRSGQEVEQEVKYDPEISSSLLTRWHREIYSYMTLGVSFLEKDLGCISKDHQDYLNNLKKKLKAEEIKKNISTRGGNLFLDALTVHQSDWRRIKDTLNPVITELERELKE